LQLHIEDTICKVFGLKYAYIKKNIKTMCTYPNNVKILDALV